MHEKEYLQEVLSIIAGNTDPVVTIENLEKLGRPAGDISLNTDLVVANAASLRITGEDRDWNRELSGEVPDAEQVATWIEDEEEIAEESLKKIKKFMADFKEGNLYTNHYSLDVIYSRFLDDGAYKSADAVYELKAKTRQEAEEELKRVKSKVPKTHPKDARYTIQDIGISASVVDKNGLGLDGRPVFEGIKVYSL